MYRGLSPGRSWYLSPLPLQPMSSFVTWKMLNAAIEIASSSVASMAHRRPLTCSASSSRLVPRPPDLVQWVRREGGFVHPKLRIVNQGSDGLGVSSLSEIPAGSDLIILPGHIPLRFQRSAEPDERDLALIELSRRIPEELWIMRLGLRLLQERATIGSFWWPYISNLPETFSVPIFFSGEDMKNLQYAPLVYQVNKRCSFLLEFEKELTSFLETIEPKHHPFDGQDVNASSLGWAMSAVSSRAFCLRGDTLSDGQKIDIHMLLPLIDMCNHSFQPNAKIVQEQEKGSSKMFVKVNLGGSGVVDGRLLAALRVLLTNKEEIIQNLDLDALMTLSEKAPLGVSVETAAIRIIIALCVVALEHFPTKVMQDESILKGNISTSMLQLAVQFRMQKKLMIIDVMRKLSHRIKTLSKQKSSA